MTRGRVPAPVVAAGTPSDTAGLTVNGGPTAAPAIPVADGDGFAGTRQPAGARRERARGPGPTRAHYQSPPRVGYRSPTRVRHRRRLRRPPRPYRAELPDRRRDRFRGTPLRPPIPSARPAPRAPPA